MTVQLDVASGRGAPPTSGFHRPRRGPRAEEIALMRRLASGPLSMSSGPIGRCVKRGWCRAELAEDDQHRTRVLFMLTDAGRALLGEG